MRLRYRPLKIPTELARYSITLKYFCLPQIAQIFTDLAFFLKAHLKSFVPIVVQNTVQPCLYHQIDQTGTTFIDSKSEFAENLNTF